KALRAVRHFGGDQTDRRDGYDLRQRKLQRARVFAVLRVEEQVAAAAHDAHIQRQARALRRLEAEREIDRADISVAARRQAEGRLKPDLFDHGLQRAEHRLQVYRQPQREPARVQPDGDRQRGDLDRAERHVDRHLNVKRAAPDEEDAVFGREADAEIKVGLDFQAGEQRRQKAVRAFHADENLALPDLAEDLELALAVVGQPGDSRADAHHELPRLDPAGARLPEDNVRIAGFAAARELDERVAAKLARRGNDRHLVVGLDDDLRADRQFRVKARFELVVVLFKDYVLVKGERLGDADRQAARVDGRVRLHLDEIHIQHRRADRRIEDHRNARPRQNV